MMQTATFAQGKPEGACAIAAFRDYTRQKIALSQRATPFLSVESLIAQRRLEEQFCQHLVQCDLGAVANDDVRFGAEFSSCLQDEALEKYDAVPRDK
jgi:hypothetical protein